MEIKQLPDIAALMPGHDKQLLAVLFTQNQFGGGNALSLLFYGKKIKSRLKSVA